METELYDTPPEDYTVVGYDPALGDSSSGTVLLDTTGVSNFVYLDQTATLSTFTGVTKAYVSLDQYKSMEVHGLSTDDRAVTMDKGTVGDLVKLLQAVAASGEEELPNIMLEAPQDSLVRLVAEEYLHGRGCP